MNRLPNEMTQHHPQPEDGSTAKSWLVVTPARNEERNLPRLAASLQRQTAKPIALWVVVDDGSSDATATVLENWQLTFPLMVVQKPNEGGLLGGSAFRSFLFGAEVGLQHASTASRILKLDADVELSAGYFEKLLEADDDAGLLGGVLVGWSEREQLDYIPGALKAYSRRAFDTISRLDPSVGFDIVDEAALRLAGLRVVVVPTAHARVTRRTGSSEGAIRGRRRNGVVCRWVGYNPTYFALRLLRHAFRRPYIVGAVAILAGYATAGRGPYPPEVRHEVARMQRLKLRRLTCSPAKFVYETYHLSRCEDPACLCDRRSPSDGPTYVGE